MAKREHGYIALIPVFIPVDKKNLESQIRAGTVLHEAVQTHDLASIMALPGIRFHAPRNGRDINTRWTSVEGVEEPAAVAAEERADATLFDQAEGETSVGFDETAAEHAAQDAEPDIETVEEPTTHGRKSRAKAA